MGIAVGHSTLHRLVGRVDLTTAQAEAKSEAVSLDGGKIWLRGESQTGGGWRDYKLVSLHGSVCEAFFQAPQTLLDWSQSQPLSPILTCLGDGHDGVWNLMRQLGGNQVAIKREVLDWYHLKENLYKVKESSSEHLKQVETLLWHGRVKAALSEFEQHKSKQAKNFQVYLKKHQERIPNYHYYQQLNICIGSGDVESKVKQVGARVKLSGAKWKRENVARILRLRCAYLNRSSQLSICTSA